VATAQTSFFSEILSGVIYKRNQGRVVRQGTFFGLTAIIVVGCVTLSNTVMSDLPAAWRTGVPIALAALGTWVAFRAVNYPPFTDFLVAVEGEMDKVSWPEWPYLWRALTVVLVVLTAFMGFMWVCDAVWVWFFSTIGFLDIKAMS